jgi:hypothetical protein
MTRTGRQAPPRGEAFYRALRDDFLRSGKSQQDFAAERGVPAGTVSAWFFKLRKLDAARASAENSGGAAIALRAPRDVPSSEPFVAVRMVDPLRLTGGTGYEVVVGRGVLRLPSDFDPARVAVLLRSLGVGC